VVARLPFFLEDTLKQKLKLTIGVLSAPVITERVQLLQLQTGGAMACLHPFFFVTFFLTINLTCLMQKKTVKNLLKTLQDGRATHQINSDAIAALVNSIDSSSRRERAVNLLLGHESVSFPQNFETNAYSMEKILCDMFDYCPLYERVYFTYFRHEKFSKHRMTENAYQKIVSEKGIDFFKYENSEEITRMLREINDQPYSTKDIYHILLQDKSSPLVERDSETSLEAWNNGSFVIM
jgi:hypothetical protein